MNSFPFVFPINSYKSRRQIYICKILNQYKLHHVEKSKTRDPDASGPIVFVQIQLLLCLPLYGLNDIKSNIKMFERSATKLLKLMTVLS